MQETPVQLLGQEDPLRRDRLPTPVFFASLVTLLVKNQPAMTETWVWYLGWEDTLEKEMATHSSILAWRIPWTEEPDVLHSPWGHKESDTTEQLSLSLCIEELLPWDICQSSYHCSTITLYAKQKKRHRCTEQTLGLCGRRRGWDVLREQHQNMYIIKGETDHQPRLDAWDKCSGLVHWEDPEGSG